MINGQYTPLNLNCIGELLQNRGLRFNPTQVDLIGTSSSLATYSPRGRVYSETLLGTLANVTSLAYSKIGSASSTTITQNTYNQLISLGSTTVPAFGNAKPSTYTKTYSGELTKYGWLRLIAYQGYNELYVNGSASYSNFVSTFGACYNFLQNTNSLIKNYNSSTTFLKTSFSNMSDLITGDITGVSLSTVHWGQDLIASGRVIDLSQIDKFGLPSTLLKSISDNHAMTASLNVALVAAGFTATDLNNLILGKGTVEQEKLLYAAFAVVTSNDLKEICALLNCQTHNLTCLADLLDPLKLFPNSYSTLTFPKYNTVQNLPTNSKTYYRIYINGNADTTLTPNIGLRLQGILPRNIACACDAFSISMLQIKNIQTMNIEKFSQVVTHMENVSGMETGSANFAINPDIAAAATNIIAKGTGPNGMYTMGDFFGALTDKHYDLQTFLNVFGGLSAPTVSTIYQQMYSLMSGPGPYENELLSFITMANEAINDIYTANQSLCDSINELYNTLGTKLDTEQTARSEAMPNLSELVTSSRDIYGFMATLNDFAIQTQDDGPALLLESIADTTTMGGNSLIGSMREIRNSLRLGLTGARLDGGVDTNPLILARPTGTTSRQNPIDGYTPGNDVADIPIVTGAATIPGSFAGSPEVRLIPPNLSVFNTGVSSSIMTPEQAVDSVIKCNCTCWDNLQ